MDAVREVVQTHFTIIITPFLMLGVGLATAALVILSLAAGVRGILMILETLLDEKPTSALVAQLARGGAIVLVLIVALAQWGSVQGFVLNFAGGASQAVSSSMGISRPPVFSIPAGSSPSPQLVAQQVSRGVLLTSMDELMMLMYRVERLYKLRSLIAGIADATQQTPPPGVDLDLWIEQQIVELEQREDERGLMDQITGYMSALIPAIQGQVIYLIGVSSVLVFSIIVFYYLMGSLISMLVALGVGPLAIAVAPIESAFTRNLGRFLLSSAVQFAFVASLTVLLSSAINAIATNYLANARLAAGFGGSAMDFAASTFLIPMLCLVFGLLVPKMLGAITETFGGGSTAKPGGVLGMVLVASKIGALTRALSPGGGAGSRAPNTVNRITRSGGASLPKP
jgi:hypothetical protein